MLLVELRDLRAGQTPSVATASSRSRDPGLCSVSHDSVAGGSDSPPVRQQPSLAHPGGRARY
jgi:hypothetical protein